MKYFPKKLTMTWIRNSYKEGSLSPEELAGEIVRRAEKYRDYNIWIVAPDLKRMMDYIEKLPKDMESLPLWGIPFAVKDNIDVAGSPTTAACPDYAYDPKEDAAVVKKLIGAGAFPVGKTNLDQFATGLVGTRSPYGEVKNALDPELISGGSSSGSAVSVALGMAAFSLGTDTAGSGRVPAALNCLVGYKPSLGAWSTKGVVPACASLDCVTVFANSLEDAEKVNLAARGVDEECCWSREYKEPLPKLPKKICLAKDGVTFYGPYEDIYKAKWEQAKKRIEDMGITIFSLSDQEGEILGTAEQFLKTQSIPFAVCGLHKKGFPLESQLTELKASYKESVNTAPHYRLYRLDTVPEKPGMVYDDKKGAAIAVEIYELPVVSIGAFLQQVKKPLCIGDVELSDGRIVKGFLCEEYGLANAKEITDIGKYEV